jgi:hypothetical protein
LVKYFRQTEGGTPESITLAEFVKGIQSEMIWGENYYEHMFMLFGHGHKLVGSIHMYWMEWE